MTETGLRTCPSCERHVRDEEKCPFCEAALPRVSVDLAARSESFRPAPKYGMPPTTKLGCAVGVLAAQAAVAYYLLR